MPKETGLMFKAPLVRAILSGQKTQTRRMVNPQPHEGCPFPNMADGADPREWFAEVWKSTGGDWVANPWVWAIDFKRIDKP